MVSPMLVSINPYENGFVRVKKEEAEHMVVKKKPFAGVSQRHHSRFGQTLLRSTYRQMYMHAYIHTDAYIPRFTHKRIHIPYTSTFMHILQPSPEIETDM